MADHNENPVTRVMDIGWMGISAVVAAVVGVIFLCGMSYMFIGLGSRGMDTKLGALGGEVADDFFTEAVPAIGQMAGPAWEVGKSQGERMFAAISPQGVTNLGPLAINWDKFKGDGIVTINKTPVAVVQPPVSGGNTSGGSTTGINPTPVPQQPLCASGISDYTSQSIQLWKLGDWEGAVAAINLAAAEECAAQDILTVVYGPFEVALNGLINGSSQSQVKILADDLIRRNPRYVGSYAAKAYIEAYNYLSNPMNEFDAPKYLAGAKVVVVKQTTSSVAKLQEWELFHRPEDEFQIAFAWGEGWQGSWTFTRAELESIASILGIGKESLVTVGNSLTIPGSFIPEALPEPQLPMDLGQPPYSAPVQPPAPQVPEVAPTVATPNVPQPADVTFGAITVIFPDGNGEDICGYRASLSGTNWVYNFSIKCDQADQPGEQINVDPNTLSGEKPAVPAPIPAYQ